MRQKVRRNHFPNSRCYPSQCKVLPWPHPQPQGVSHPSNTTQQHWNWQPSSWMLHLWQRQSIMQGGRHQAAVYHHHFNPPNPPNTTPQPSLIRASVSKDLMQGNWNGPKKVNWTNCKRFPLPVDRNSLQMGNPNFCTNMREAVYGNLLQGNLIYLVQGNCSICQQVVLLSSKYFPNLQM